uniref:Uncharacterized protein n=1 Tax=Callorhinchus milii TaxID=7868 RepID=A0A4W3HJC4_CALMI
MRGFLYISLCVSCACLVYGESFPICSAADVADTYFGITPGFPLGTRPLITADALYKPKFLLLTVKCERPVYLVRIWLVYLGTVWPVYLVRVYPVTW